MTPPRADSGAFAIAFGFGLVLGGMLVFSVFTAVTEEPENRFEEALAEFIYQAKN